MTDEQDKLLTEFHVRIKQLILQCEKLKSENTKLAVQIEDKDMLITELEKKVGQLNSKYENLKSARALSSMDSQATVDAKTRLVKLVRDVDRCIAMLKN